MDLILGHGLDLNSLHSHDLNLKKDTTFFPIVYFLIDDIINYIEMAKILWISKLKLLHITHNSLI
jgi:hypothetical protein